MQHLKNSAIYKRGIKETTTFRTSCDKKRLEIKGYAAKIK
ncbi:hypothetical protein BH23BAC1_BH23BAC1_40250 [soil metagenome]